MSPKEMRLTSENIETVQDYGSAETREEIVPETLLVFSQHGNERASTRQTM